MISQFNQLTLKEDEQQLCISILFEKKTNRRNLFFALAIREYFDSIRQQIDELQREKQNLSLEQISREQTYQSELEQIATDKE